MKSFAECVAEYKATNNNIAALDKESEEIRAALPNQIRNVNTDEFRKLHSRLDEIAGQKKILEITAKIWKENARQAVFAETVGVVAELIGKYAGKQFGEKTAAKFKEEFFERTGFHVYFNREQYREEIHLVDTTYLFRHDDLEISVKSATVGNNNKLFDGNKLVAYNAEDFKLNFCADYVENPERRAREIMDRYAELKAAYALFENQCKMFNELLPSSINNVYAGNFKGYLY